MRISLEVYQLHQLIYKIKYINVKLNRQETILFYLDDDDVALLSIGREGTKRKK